jgi:hypothetical protein
MNYQDKVDHIVPKGYQGSQKDMPLTKKFIGKEIIEKYVIMKDGKFLGKYAGRYSSILHARLMTKSEAELIVEPNEEIKLLTSVHYVIL